MRATLLGRDGWSENTRRKAVGGEAGRFAAGEAGGADGAICDILSQMAEAEKWPG
jgi:hypothetical protein